MKHQYESELIEEIVDTRGHKKSSLHYESECVETWIEEAKGAYPKLCDYESEWLKYISVLDDTGGSEDPEPPIGEFPYVVLSDVTEATIDNVVPYAYKSAILKGQTLVNIIDKPYHVSAENNWHKAKEFTFKFIKPNTDYFIVYDVTTDLFPIAMGFLKDNTKWSKNIEGISTNKGILKLNSGDYPNYFRIIGHKESSSLIVNSIIVIEYQEGIENWNIPYFEGMQSVEMPVLTTYTNLFTRFITKGYIQNGQHIGESTDPNLLSDYIEIFGKHLAFRRFKKDGTPVNSFGEFAFYDANKNFIDWLTGKQYTDESVTVPENTKYIRVWSRPTDDGIDEIAMLICSKEKPSTITEYQPCKTNILTVNEDVTLRSNGSVYDELDLLTGKLTQRIDEDGSVLTQEIVKTVDLNIQDQDGKTLSAIKPIEGKMYLSTSSNTIKPLFSGEIPVEAITQNLASFIDLEMEE